MDPSYHQEPPVFKPMRVLVGCEFSGTVRDAFIARGHLAISCDLLPSDKPGPHLQCDVLDILYQSPKDWPETASQEVRETFAGGFDLFIGFPPCTHLAVSGARWFKEKVQEQADALAFVRRLMDAPIEKIAIENPVSVISSKIRRPDQIIQPYHYGHGEKKSTCLWLKNLPLLRPTNRVEGRESKVHMMPPSPDRWKLRSLTLPGIAQAFAEQWG